MSIRLFAMNYLGKLYEFPPVAKESSGTWKEYGIPVGIPTFKKIYQRNDFIQQKMEAIALSQRIDPKKLGFQIASVYKGKNETRVKIQPYTKNQTKKNLL